MRELHLVAIGKLKDKDLLSIENLYHKRIPFLKIHEYKNSNEALKKLKSMGACYPILLEEKGKQFKNSDDFSKWIYAKTDEINKPLVFVFGASDGHIPEIKELGQDSISLSGLTFPHQLARILLIEQIYRATTIHTGHPYSK